MLVELLRHTRLSEAPDPEVAGFAFATFRQQTVGILSPLGRGGRFAGGGDFWAQWAQRQY